MVERRLRGERFGGARAPLRAAAWCCAPGCRSARAALVKTLNALKYEQKAEAPAARGGVHGRAERRGASGRAQTGRAPPEADQRGRSTRSASRRCAGSRSKRAYATITLEPELITYLFDESREKRRLVRYEELPDHLVKAVLAIEDRRFFSHPGLDPFRIVGAAVRNWEADSYIQGGSTITQQLVKNFFLTPEKTMRRKVQEALLAFVLERRADKKDILELYLNEVYLGQVGSFSIHGVGEGARMYFHKDVGNLTLVEARAAGGDDPVPEPLQPLPPSAARAGAAQPGAARHGARRSFLAPRAAEAAMAQPLRVQSPSFDSAGGAVLHRPREGAARAALRREGPGHPEPGHPHQPRPLAAGAWRSGCSRDGLDEGGQDDPPAQEQGAGAGRADRDRAAHGRGAGAGGRPLLRRQPVQPREQRAAPARQHVQAVRVPGRVRGHVRRPEPAARSRPPPWSRTRPPRSSSTGRSTAPRTTRATTWAT